MPRWLYPCLLALAFQGLAAQTEVHLGLQGGLSIPAGDLTDHHLSGTHSAFGAHFGGHASLEIQPRHEIRIHMAYHTFPGLSWPERVTTDAEATQFGVDYVHHLRGPEAGWYFLAGGHADYVKLDQYRPAFHVTASQAPRPGYRAGFGVHTSAFSSLEAIYNNVKVDPGGREGFTYSRMQWIDLALSLRLGRR